VIFHLLQNYNLPSVLAKGINIGGAGVHVFILCSGFGLYLSHLNRPLTFVQFIRKRFVKIYIPYIIIIIVSFFIPFMYVGNDRLEALISSIFLYRMFDENYITAFGYQFWFISMIFQFYIFFILIAYLNDKLKPITNIILSIFISLLWSTFVILLGKEDLRIWNGFFLQYLWEFVLGMQLAKSYKKKSEEGDTLNFPSRYILLLYAFLGLMLVGYTGIRGGFLKMYNDIPSLIGYLSLSLFFYSFKIKWFNKFFLFTSKFSYEWYLLHILIFFTIFHFFCINLVSGIFSFFLSYVLSILYNKLYNKLFSYISR